MPFGISHRHARCLSELPTGARTGFRNSPQVRVLPIWNRPQARALRAPRKQWTSSGALQGHAPHRRQTPGTQEVRFYLGGTRNCSMGHQIVHRLEPLKTCLASVKGSLLTSSGVLQRHEGHRGHTPGTQEVRFYFGERPIHRGPLDWSPPGSPKSHFRFCGKSQTTRRAHQNEIAS